MAHFAEINESGIVLRVLVVNNDLEYRGADFLANDLGLGGTWVQTSYNGNIRKNFAAIGDVYDAARAAFIAPKPFPSWVFNETTCRWDAPIPYPNDGRDYSWNEETLSWSA
jgi:hypothetical protein